MWLNALWTVLGSIILLLLSLSMICYGAPKLLLDSNSSKIND